MRIVNVIDKKPVIMTGHTKDEVDHIIGLRFGAGWACGGTHNRTWSCRKRGAFHGGEFILVNYRKLRRKSRVTPRLVQGERGPSYARTVVREAHWIAYVYIFRAELVARAQQKARHFEVELLQDW